MTVRAHDDLPERPADPDALPWDDRDAEIETRAADLELRIGDEDWCDLLLDGLGDYLLPIRHRKYPTGTIYQSDMDKIRQARLRELRGAIQSHDDAAAGRVLEAAFHSALVARVEGEL